MPSEQDIAIKINVGPHVSITERSEKLVCTRCDFLKHNLIRSGRDPQWECLCLHPSAKEVNEAMPGADRCWSTNGAPGCWIGEQPDTPEWCPLLKQNIEQPSASDRRANVKLSDASDAFAPAQCSAVRPESFKSPIKEGQNTLRFLLQYPAMGIS